MTIIPKKNTLMISFVWFVAISLVVGVGKVTYGMYSRVNVTAHVTSQIGHWHQQIANELPPSQSDEWNRMGNCSPLPLLRSCAVEYKIEKNGHRAERRENFVASRATINH